MQDHVLNIGGDALRSMKDLGLQVQDHILNIGGDALRTMKDLGIMLVSELSPKFFYKIGHFFRF